MLKSILFTHTDLDGAGCRIIFELVNIDNKKGEDYIVTHCQNNTVDDDVMNCLETYKDIINEDTIICFSDIVAHDETLMYLKDRFKNINIWDHHITNYPAQLVIPSTTIIDENEMGIKQAGTSLIYQYYVEQSLLNPIEIFDKKYNQSLISEFVDTVRSYDTYEWKETNNMKAKELVTLFFLLGMEAFCKRYVEKLSSEKIDEELISSSDMDFVKAKLDNEQANIDRITPDDVFHINLDGYKTAFLLGGRGANVSELSYQFLQKYPEFDVFAAFLLNENNKVSFRSVKDNVDVSELAAKLHGGGHKLASGTTLPNDVVKDIAFTIFDYMNNLIG